MREINPVMYMYPGSGIRRFRIEDAIDDVLIAEAEERAIEDAAETTLQRLCRELNIEYTDIMRSHKEELQRLVELGHAGARMAKLREVIEQLDKIPQNLQHDLQ